MSDTQNDVPYNDPVRLLQDVIALMEGNDPYREWDTNMRRRCKEAVYRMAFTLLPPIPKEPGQDKLAWAYFNEPLVQQAMNARMTYADLIDILARDRARLLNAVEQAFASRPTVFMTKLQEVEKERKACEAILPFVPVTPPARPPTAAALVAEYGVWGDYPDYSPADWRYETANCDTRLGYWEWVAAKLEETPDG